jgi:hypothetical protein
LRIGQLVFAAVMAMATLSAAPVNIFGTGVDGFGNPLPDGSIDPNYSIISSPLGAIDAIVINSGGFPITPGPWAPNGGSKWIGPQADQSVGNTPGEYIYRTIFDLSGFDLATVVLSGSWTSDNDSSIRINGVAVGPTVSFTGYASLVGFSITNGFVSGLNTLDFVVNNGSDSDNPTGLLVEVRGEGDLAAIPEPASFALIGLGLVGLAAIRRTRK